jgi:thermitase
MRAVARASVVAALLGLLLVPWAASADEGGSGVELQGHVTALAPPNDFVLYGATTVRTGGDTEWAGDLSGYADLRVDQGLRVHGAWSDDGSMVVASRVELADGGEGDGEGVDFESTATLERLDPPDGFTLADARTYRVDATTELDPAIGSYQGLAVGQVLTVHAVRLHDEVNLARSVELEADGTSGPGIEEIRGEVAAADATAITLSDGTVVLHDQRTVFEGEADQWWSLEPGWQVEIQAVRLVTTELLALSVHGEDDRPPSTGGEDYEPSEALVVVRSGASAPALATRFGAELVETIGASTCLLRWTGDIDDDLLAGIHRDPDVLAVEPNYRFRDPESVRRRYVVVDARPSPWKLLTQPAASVVNLAGAGPAGGQGVIVAVLDTGVDPNHPFLAGRIVPGGLDLVDGDSEPWETRNGLDDDGDGDVDEAAGHGTFVASLVALVAPEAGILPYRVLDDDWGGTAFGLAEAIAHAIAAGANVINLSLTYHRHSAVVDLLLEQAAAAGIVVVAAAGNDGASVVPYPASSSQVVGVTAATVDGTSLAPFANRSQLVALAAPGDQIYGAVDGGRYGTWSGTSMAAPFVAGTAAVLLGTDHGLDPQLVRHTLVQGGRPLLDGTWSGVLLDVGRAEALLGGASGQVRPTPARRLGPQR